jgi:hypothetical protein
MSCETSDYPPDLGVRPATALQSLSDIHASPMRHSHHPLSIAMLTSLALLLSACAGYSPNDHLRGSSREQVIQVMGKPAIEIAILGGHVMQYPRGPFGKHTYFVYLNEEGTTTRWTQVLDEKNFAQINAGMHRDEVVANIGPSRDTFGLARGRGYVWNYRYVTPHCFWFQIEFASNDTVRSTGYGRPPECRVRAVSAGM